MVKPKHHLGQNFLVNVGLIDHVLSKIDLKPHDHVVEIGPGLGVLTQAMAPLIARIDAIELDNDLKKKLAFLKGMEHVSIHWQDALAQPLSSWYLNRPFRLISNLPYQITSPILFECLAAIDSLQDVVLLLQYEVVKRLSASPHTKAYGQLTVLIQAAFEVECLLKVSPGSFRPPPKVDSAFVWLKPKKKRDYPAKELHYIVKKAFLHRRKMLRSSLKSFQHLPLPLRWDDRPEDIGVSQWIDIASVLAALIQKGDAPPID